MAVRADAPRGPRGSRLALEDLLVLDALRPLAGLAAAGRAPKRGLQRERQADVRIPCCGDVFLKVLLLRGIRRSESER